MFKTGYSDNKSVQNMIFFKTLVLKNNYKSFNVFIFESFPSVCTKSRSFLFFADVINNLVKCKGGVVDFCGLTLVSRKGVSSFFFNVLN